MDEALQAKSIKKHYRIIVEFELDVPDENYVLVEHERKGLSKDLCGYALSCQRLTIYSKDHPKVGRFRRKPENIKAHFDNQEEFLDYSI